MRLVHVSRRYVPEIIGGYESNCQRFSEEWVRRGHAVTVLTRRVAGTPERDTIAGVQVVRGLDDVTTQEAASALAGRIYQARVAFANRRNRVATRAVLRQVEPEAVVFWGMQSWLMSPILAVHAAGIPCLFDLGDYWLAEALQMFSPDEALKGHYRRRVLLGGRFDPSLVDSAVVHSRFMRQHYIDSGVSASVLEVIPRGIDPKFLDRAAARREPEAKRPLRILCVGRLVPDKGAKVLAEAFATIEPRFPAAELHFYGATDSTYEAELRARCEQLHLLDRKIFLHGAVASERMPEIYAASDIVAFPVLWDEPSSNVLLEAMAAGLPVVATRTGSNAEFVQQDESGLLVERNDSRGLAAALGRLCDDADLRNRMGTRGRAQVLSEHRQIDVFDRTERWLKREARRTRGVPA